jgi:phytoene dehydrogenase-like protein
MKALVQASTQLKFLISTEPKMYRKGSHEPPSVLPRCYTAAALAHHVVSQFPGPPPAGLNEEFRKIFQEILSIPYKELCVEMDTVPLGQWIKERSPNPMVLGFFTRLGVNMMMMDTARAAEVLSAGRIFAIIRMWLAGEGVNTLIVPNLMDGLLRPFAQAITSFGGEIRTGHRVVEVIVEGNKAAGVVLNVEDEEKRIYADRVIINCLYKDIPELFKKLPPEVEEPVRKFDEAWLVDYWTFTGLREKVTHDPSYVMVQDPGTGSNLGGMKPWSLQMPWTAPPGKQLIFMEKIYSREDFKRLNINDIRAEMNELQEEVYPGFKQAIEVQKYATHQPLFHHQYMAFPKIPQKATSVEDLYFVGDGTTPQYGQGFDGPSSTGILCAKRILGIE